MAGSRLHKLGSIYERVTGLLKSGAFNDADKPIWYDVYKQYPPMYDPRFDRSAPDVEVKQIFYEEDFIRAKIHKIARLKYFNLNSRKQTSQTKAWIKTCQNIMEERGVSLDEAIKLMDITGEQGKHDKIDKIKESTSKTASDVTKITK